MKLISNDYSIRRIREEDLKMLLSWRNSERIRSVMLTDHEITWEEHYNWFKRNEHNEPSRNLIFEYKGTPIGYIGYTEYDDIGKTCSPGVYLGQLSKIPADAGIQLIKKSIEYAFKELHMLCLVTDVFANNKPSLVISQLMGYKIKPNSDYFVLKNGKKELVKKLIFTYDMWIEKKKRISGR